jgi:serine/threonine-protein kinase
MPAMDPERWVRVEALFHRALELDPQARGTFLATECAGDAELLAQVEHLIRMDARPSERVERMEQGVVRPLEDPLIGRDVGPFRLKERVGIGGMGVVYRAERVDGLFEQEVAVKLLRSEIASDALLQRFELERRTLAALSHPNIAQLHDGGTTADGRPYFVMEFVRGTPIDRYCDEHRSTIDERLRLFVAVCRAVHFAHQSLVVHRDIKPGNILVNQKGEPKLLDFGIARLSDEVEAEVRPALTRTGGTILTPEYASPEQILGGAVTTAIDVYSLGIVLYELLTGRKPYASDTQSLVDWHRNVLERVPTRPSSMVLAQEVAPPGRASTAAGPDELAARRGLDPKGLRRRLSGDLDRIVLMALRKEPARRYPSVRDMADDIERHFAGYPVLARSDSMSYRARRFVRRNRLAVTAAVLVFCALVFGLIAARRGEVRATEQAVHARIEAESFEGIADFLMDAFLATTGPLDAEATETKRHRIRLHADQLRVRYADQEHLRANLLDSLGRVALRLGLFADAEDLVRESLGIRAAAFGEDSLEYALSLRSLGMLHYARDEAAPAAEAFSRSLAIHRRRAGETHADIASLANDLAATNRMLGRRDEAEALHREALALRRRAADGSLEVAESLNNLAMIRMDRREWEPALELLQESLSIRRRILGPEDSLTLQSMSNAAAASWNLERREEALALLAEVEAGSRALRVDGEEGLAQVLSNKAGMLIVAKRYAEADAALEEALALRLRRLGPTHSAVVATLTKRARLQALTGRNTEAAATWERIIEARRDPAKPQHLLAEALCDQGQFLWGTGAREAGRGALEEAVALLRANSAGHEDLLARAEENLGAAWLAGGDKVRGRSHLEAALRLFEAGPAADPQAAERVRQGLARNGG